MSERFWSKVEKTNDCWNWLSAKDRDGYGLFWLNGGNVRASRYALELEGIEIPQGLAVCTTCDNPACVNPDHLYFGHPQAKGESMPVEERFWSKVDKSGDCWTWTAGLSPAGYGQFNITTKGAKRPIGAHRMAYELEVGSIPKGRHVLHHCDNPLCVRPEHLFLGDQVSNMADMTAKGRQNKGETHHMAKLTEGDVITIRELVSVGCKQIHVAKFFDMTAQAISDIVLRKNWKHL